MIRFRLLPLIAVACIAIPVSAFAQQAFTSKYVNLRAGPARDYPLVAQLGPGTSVSVAGCINGYTWCDVFLPDGNRGWVYAQNLNYPYQGRQVPLITYGSAIGLPIVAFAIGSYWGQYYRGRPWYRQQPQWANRPRPPVGRPPPRPRPPGLFPQPGRPDRPGFVGGQRPPNGARPQGGGARPTTGGRPPGGGGGRPQQGGVKPQPR
jgi:uncharacterized protein YraI